LSEVIGRDAELRLVDGVGEADLTAAVAERRADVVLVNGDALGGVIELRRLVLEHQEASVVVAVGCLRRERDDSLLAAGARVVVPITAEVGELCAALRLVARGLVGPPRARRSAGLSGPGLLTARETEVVELLVQKRSALEIAEALHVTTATVNSHRRRIYEKLGVHSRRELTLYAAQPMGVAEAEPPSHRSAAQARDRLPYRRLYGAGRESSRAVVIDMCAALGARRWLSGRA
jgi:DNA-binding NarL/FixJ family response regulator